MWALRQRSLKVCRKEWNTTLSGKPSFWWMYRQLGMEWDLPQAFVVFPSAGVLPGQGGGGFIGQETGQGLDQGLHFLNRPWAPFAVLLPIFQQTLPAEYGGVLFQWVTGSSGLAMDSPAWRRRRSLDAARKAVAKGSKPASNRQ